MVTLVSMSQILTHVTLLTTLSGRHYSFPQCTDEKIEVKKLAQDYKVAEPNFKPGRILALYHQAFCLLHTLLYVMLIAHFSQPNSNPVHSYRKMFDSIQC